jgi:hypothetical protein
MRSILLMPVARLPPRLSERDRAARSGVFERQDGPGPKPETVRDQIGVATRLAPGGKPGRDVMRRGPLT